jgi:hypothetical protein
MEVYKPMHKPFEKKTGSNLDPYGIFQVMVFSLMRNGKEGNFC